MQYRRRDGDIPPLSPYPDDMAALFGLRDELMLAWCVSGWGAWMVVAGALAFGLD